MLIKDRGEFTKHIGDAATRSARLREIAQELLPEYGPNWHRHSLVTQRVEALSRLLHYNNLYQQIVDVPGVVCEFGVQWGATVAELINLRNIYEPFNPSRVIYGFDTFEGFPSLHAADGGVSAVGDYASMPGYADRLEEILTLLESFSPLAEMKRFELVRGDVIQTLEPWLVANPQAIVAMAIFDVDLYEPTKFALEKILPRLTRGSLLVFDELNCPTFPGETQALSEVLGLDRLRLRRSNLQPHCAWGVWE